MDEARLQKLCDESDIREVLTRYCRATDRGDTELLRSVYWPDATDDHVVFSGNAMDYVDYSAPMLEPIFPAHTSATITGPISRIMLIPTIAGNHDSAPKRASVGRDCKVSTKPIIKAVKPTNGSER